MIGYLIINKSNGFKRYDEEFKVFSKWNEALEYAKENGYSCTFIEPSLKPGIMNSFMCGDVDISIMAIEII